MRTYYEVYWSEEGFCPRDALTRFVTPLLERYMPAVGACLDLGCGDGRTAGLWLRSHVRSYAGVDVSMAGLCMARALGLNVAQIGDASELPFGSEAFDAAVCIEVFEHLFEPQQAARELLRVLRPGGLLLVTVPNVAYWRHRLDLAVRGRWDPAGDAESVRKPWRDPHLRFFTAPTLRAMLEQVGYTDVRVAGHAGEVIGHLPGVRKWASLFPDALLARRIADLAHSPLQRRLQEWWPSLFGKQLHALAWKSPAAG